MKTTAFKIFASCVAIVCLASPTVTKAAPALKSVSGTSENPIVQLQGIKNENLVGLNFVDLKPHHSRLIANKVVQKPAMAVHEPMVSQNLHRQRRTFDPEEEYQLRNEQAGETSSSSVHSNEDVPMIPNLSNESQDSQQSHSIHNFESNEIHDSQQSNDVQNSQSDEYGSVPQSDEYRSVPQSHEFRSVPDSDEFRKNPLDEDYQESHDVYKFRDLPKHYNSQESYEGEGSNDPPEDYDGSVSTNDDQEESDTLKPIPLLRTTA